MTSELRPAVGVWREASDAATLGSVKYKPAADQAAAAVIEAYGDEREAKGREEQAREIERLGVIAEGNARLVCKVLDEKDAEQAAELAKFKALAETLAGALEQIEEGTYPRPLGKPWRMDASSSKHDRCIHDAWMYETCEGCLDAFTAEALRQYKEARDA